MIVFKNNYTNFNNSSKFFLIFYKIVKINPNLILNPNPKP